MAYIAKSENNHFKYTIESEKIIFQSLAGAKAAVNIGGVFMIFIVADLVPYIECDQHAAGQSGSETENIDERKNLVLPKVVPGNFKIGSYHGVLIYYLLVSCC